jgi:Type VI secretion, TssG
MSDYRWLLENLGVAFSRTNLFQHEARALLSLTPGLWMLSGDILPSRGIARVLSALLTIPVDVEEAPTQRTISYDESSHLGERGYCELGQSWFIGRSFLERATRIEISIRDLSNEDRDRLVRAGWIVLSAPDRPQPAAKLEAITEAVCPVWIEWTWRIGNEQPQTGWRLGRPGLSELRESTVLGTKL